MHDFLVTICPAFLWIFAIVHLGFIVLFVLKYVESRKIAFLLCGFVSFGLFYDALILALGTFLTEGAVLATLSQARYVSHGALIPLLFAITAFVLDVKKPIKIALVSVTGVLVVLGIAEGFATVLEFSEVANVCRYASSKDLTPAWAERSARSFPTAQLLRS